MKTFNILISIQKSKVFKYSGNKMEQKCGEYNILESVDKKKVSKFPIILSSLII